MIDLLFFALASIIFFNSSKFSLVKSTLEFKFWFGRDKDGFWTCLYRTVYVEMGSNDDFSNPFKSQLKWESQFLNSHLMQGISLNWKRMETVILCPAFIWVAGREDMRQCNCKAFWDTKITMAVHLWVFGIHYKRILLWICKQLVIVFKCLKF